MSSHIRDRGRLSSTSFDSCIFLAEGKASRQQIPSCTLLALIHMVIAIRSRM